MLLINVFIKKIIVTYNSLILFSHKKIVQLTCIFFFLLSQETFFFQTKTLQFNVNYSHICVFTFHSYVRLSRNKIKQKKCNQIEVLLQGDFRLKVLKNYRNNDGFSAQRVTKLMTWYYLPYLLQDPLGYFQQLQLEWALRTYDLLEHSYKLIRI